MILEKLMEKKDLRAYIDIRIKVLQLHIKQVIAIEKPGLRQYAKRQLQGRIRELRHLRSKVDNLRKASVQESKSLANLSKKQWSWRDIDDGIFTDKEYAHVKSKPRDKSKVK